MKKKEASQFVVCLDNKGYLASLEVGKIYLAIPDKQAQAEGLIRIVDESGEDYAFDAERFYPINVPAVVEEALLKTSRL